MTDTKKTKYRFFTICLILVFLALSACVVVAASRYYKREIRKIKTGTHEALVSIASLKVSELSVWRSERLIDARSIMGNPILAAEVAAFAGGDLAKAEKVQAWINNFSSSMWYKGAALFDGKGTRILSDSQGGSTTGIEKKVVMEALGTKETVFSSFHRYGGTDYINLDLAAPIILHAQEAPVGAVLLRVDPTRFIYPLLQSWPIPKKTAETLLVERQGDEVVYLNNLKYRDDASLTLRFPVTAVNLLGAMAARGVEGVVEGVDYRGVKVLGCIKKVPDSSWVLVAKIDKDEAYAPVRGEFLRVLATAAAFILFWLVSVLFIWQRQRASATAKECEAVIKAMALERHYSYLTKYANDLIILLDKDFRFLETNERVADFYGYTREELIGMHPKQLSVPETRDQFEEQIKSLDATGKAFYETVHQRKDGTRFPVETSLRAVDVEGKRFYQAIIRDITERKKSEEIILESGRQWKITLDAINDSVCLIEPDGRILCHNAATEKLLKRTGKEIDGHFCYRIVHGLSHPIENCPIVRMNASGHRESEVLLIGDMWVEVTVDPVFDDEGAMKAAVHVIQDITERKKSEEVLRQNEEFLRLQIDRMPIAYIVWNHDFRVIAWNPAAESMFGFKRNEALGRHAYDIIVPKESQAEVDKIWQRLLSGDATANSVNENITKDGRRIICRWSNTPVKNADGTVKGVLSMTEDVTGSFKAEIELAMYREHLEEMVMERTGELESFSYSVSHDLRAPIRAISGFINILKEEYSGKIDTEGNRIIDIIVKNTRAMGQLIDDLLAFSRLGRQDAQFGEIDMGFMVEDVYGSLVCGQEGRMIEFNKGKLCGLFGDRTQIRQVLVNLISNSLKFTRKREKAKIEIGSEEKGGEIIYHVRDNGEGFDMKYVSKLFGVFQRLHRQEDFEGTGIGLAIVKRIITKHGGRVWADGAIGQGATFYFSLPKRSS